MPNSKTKTVKKDAAQVGFRFKDEDEKIKVLKRKPVTMTNSAFYRAMILKGISSLKND